MIDTVIARDDPFALTNSYSALVTRPIMSRLFAIRSRSTACFRLPASTTSLAGVAAIILFSMVPGGLSMRFSGGPSSGWSIRFASEVWADEPPADAGLLTLDRIYQANEFNGQPVESKIGRAHV